MSDTAELYYRDLSARQNGPVTAAEKELFRTAKRYSDKDLKEFSAQATEGDARKRPRRAPGVG